MQIPETPTSVEQLDLMIRLDAYADREATWHLDGSEIGPDTARACRALHTCLIQLVEHLLAPLLDRTTARELETFTMHDRSHGLKVAHLMWYILDPHKRKRLTPPEIGMLVAAAHLHDAGMALNQKERELRLSPDSDLWNKLELQESQKAAISKLRALIEDPGTPATQKERAVRKLAQAEEVLLSQDTRERHGTRDRYEELVAQLEELHQEDPVRIPDIEACLSFDGDSYLSKLIDICVSHNQDAETLVQRDDVNFERLRFPSDYPVGRTSADLHMVAAALRLADVLDFDRERTPPVLFHYLLPGTLDLDDRSVLEWSKHLAIASWHIESDAIVFRGRSNSHIIHHAIVRFSAVIEDEIEATHATFAALDEEATWPFALPSAVQVQIHEEGYRYIPYRFELDDERIYELLMGGAIYDDPLVAVRELVQNAVDACKLRDAITRMHEPHLRPNADERITVRYEEATDDFPFPCLSVTDSGTGMDALILERYFLKVGRSYYRSADFNETRVDLRKRGLDFAPVSEFGIGFLSSFLMADRVTVETAIWEPIHEDSRKRILQIDGPTRLIRLDERRNEGPGRFKGTRVTLVLSSGGSSSLDKAPPSCEKVKEYLEKVCLDLPYRLNLEHVSDGHLSTGLLDSQGLIVEVPPYLEPLTIRIPVADEEFGLEGEIVLANTYRARRVERKVVEDASTLVLQSEDFESRSNSDLLRGGFRVGSVPGMPISFLRNHAGKVRLTWASQESRRYLMPNLARTSTTNTEAISHRIERIWLAYLVDHVDSLETGQTYELNLPSRSLSHHAWLEAYGALTIYRLGKNGWYPAIIANVDTAAAFKSWEESRGNPVELSIRPMSELSTALLNAVLPRITTLQLVRGGDYYVTSPVSGWGEVLQGWHTYITDPIEWGLFADYVGNIEHLLLYNYAGVQHLNSRFKDNFTTFDREELHTLHAVLKKIDKAKNYLQRVQLTQDEMTLFQRAQETAGNLQVGTPPIRDSWSLDSVVLPSASS